MPATEETVTFGGEEIRLVVPAAISLRQDLYLAAADNTRRASAAALGACWRGKGGRPRANLKRAKFDVLAYGGLVIDELVGRGHTLVEILEAGGVAWALVEASIGDTLGLQASAEEVEATEDFTDPTAATGSG